MPRNFAADRSFFRFVRDHAYDRQTAGRTEFSSLYRVCITCSAVITFYRAALNAGRFIYDEAVYQSICVSVFLSVKGVDCDKTEERCVQIFRRAKSPIFSRYLLVEPQRFNTNRKSTTSFPMSLR